MCNKATSQGLLFVISSPSGAGKTTLAKRLAAEFKLEFSVSYTTRKPRPGEVEGKDYYFVTPAEFDSMVAGNKFAEWALVHGNRYGTGISTVERSINQGQDCLFDVDYQGGQKIRFLWPKESVLCFILPPSMDELERRLRRRATDDPEVIERRLSMACNELQHFREYDYLVVNDNLERAYDNLRAVYLSARSTRSRQEGLAERLLAEAAKRKTWSPP